MKVQCFDVRKNKLVTVGTLKNGVFIKKVNPLKHKLNKFDAYGIQSTALEFLEQNECRTVIFKEPTRKLKSSLDDWLRPDIRHLNYGSGSQAFMPINRMEVVEQL